MGAKPDSQSLYSLASFSRVDDLGTANLHPGSRNLFTLSTRRTREPEDFVPSCNSNLIQALPVKTKLELTVRFYKNFKSILACYILSLHFCLLSPSFVFDTYSRISSHSSVSSPELILIF
ncbi:hypothetical protein ACMFMG_000095 [Clarireedia jacksonii]